MLRFPPLTLLVRTCLIAFLVAYVALLVAVNWLGQADLVRYLALSSGEVWIGNVWQLATYALVQDTSPQGVMQFIISAIFFWWIVAAYEQSFATKRTIQVLVCSLFGASIPAFLVGLFLPGVLYGFMSMTLGAFTAHAWAMKILKQQANFFGVWTMKPTTMIWLILGLSLLHFLASRDFVSLAGDLGATGTGILFTEWISRPPGTPERKRKKSGGRRRGPALQVIEGGKDDPPQWLN